MESYCFRCKKPTKSTSEKMVETKNNRKMLKGQCTKCGATKCKFIKSSTPMTEKKKTKKNLKEDSSMDL